MEAVQTQTHHVQIGQAVDRGFGRAIAILTRYDRHDRDFLRLSGVVEILYIHERDAVVPGNRAAECVLRVGQVASTAGAGADLGQQRAIADEHRRLTVQLAEQLIQHVQHGLVVGVDRGRGRQVDRGLCACIQLSRAAGQHRVQAVKASRIRITVDRGVVEQVDRRLDMLLQLELHFVDLAVGRICQHTVYLERAAEDLQVDALGLAVSYSLGVLRIELAECGAGGRLQPGVAISQGRTTGTGRYRVVEGQTVEQQRAAAEIVNDLLSTWSAIPTFACASVTGICHLPFFYAL